LPSADPATLTEKVDGTMEQRSKKMKGKTNEATMLKGGRYDMNWKTKKEEEEEKKKTH